MKDKQKPKHNPSGHTTKFFGLLDMVAPIAHITQQNSLIGSPSEIIIFHWSQ